MTQPNLTGTREMPTPRPPNRVITTWQHDLVFESRRADGKGGVTIVDGNTIQAQGPVDTLLTALATCAMSDVVSILHKQRTPPTSVQCEVVGTRVETTPRHLSHVLLKFTIDAPGLDRDAAERAVSLSVTKYCSVRDSIRPDVPVEWEIDLGDGR